MVSNLNMERTPADRSWDEDYIEGVKACVTVVRAAFRPNAFTPSAVRPNAEFSGRTQP